MIKNIYAKKVISVFILLALIGASSFAAPQPVYSESILSTILGVVLGPIGLIANVVDCSVNIFWGCSSNNGGSGGGTVAAVSCTSAANVCGMTADGNKLDNGSCDAATPADSLCPVCSSAENACHMKSTGYIVNGVCNAVVLSIDQCPVPMTGWTLATPNNQRPFYAIPTSVLQGASSTIYWNVPNATACVVKGNGLDTGTTTPTGTLGTGVLTRSTEFTMLCEDTPGGPTNYAKIRIDVSGGFSEF